MSLAALRQQLAQVIEGTKPGTPGLATGIAALDGVLPGGGLPRGRLTELLGAPGCGKTSLVRRMVERAVCDGAWVAYVDATRTLAPREWASLGAHEGLWMVRPRNAERGAWCADVLLRSGAFALVVLDGAPRLSREVAVRLTLLARESDAALLVLGDDAKGSALGGALRMRVTRVGDAKHSLRDALGPRAGDAKHSLRDALGPRAGDAKHSLRDALGPLRGPAAASRRERLAPPSPRAGAREGAAVLRIARAAAGGDAGNPPLSARADAAREADGLAAAKRPQDRAAVRELCESESVRRPSGDARQPSGDARQPSGDARQPSGDAHRTSEPHTRILVTIEKGGPYQTVSIGEVDRDIAVARRVRTYSEIPDRRGVARQQRRESPRAAQRAIAHAGAHTDGGISTDASNGGER